MPDNVPGLAPLLVARNVSKSYNRGRWPAPRFRITAISDIDLTIFPQSALALVGKSGAGKSTLARCLAGLEIPDSGEIRFHGNPRGVQLVFQHSATAMNPAFPAIEIVAEPLRIQKISKRVCHERALEVMEKLGLSREWARRSPLTFSGGQRQRLLLARALILNPKVLILDEALAGLDIPAQLRIANSLLELQSSVSMIVISHDLRMAAYLAGQIAVLDQGKIVEMAPARELFSHPQSLQTRELIAALPEVPEGCGNE
ncbi:MAG TPA: ATP-binding cassette domain-containing protein [Bryobacteraceae bacterium]|jgi:ABC-type dipeptide/oligopeptide/nickel transport system ATPase subunit|nr:ATP-binding cassette domain-containing protein [Bryobacteraceae bacterium]